MNRFNRVTIEQHVMDGQPCIRNTGLTVRRVLEALKIYSSHEDILREYPGLEEEDLRQALEFSAYRLNTYIADRFVELPVA